MKASQHVDETDPVIRALIESGRINPRGYDEDKADSYNGAILPIPDSVSNEEWWRRMMRTFCDNERGWDSETCDGLYHY